jgi:hypothetical protein
LVLTLTALLSGCIRDLTLAEMQADNARFFSNDFTCTKQNSANVTYNALYEKREVFLNRCIRVNGFTNGHTLVGSATDLNATTEYSDIGLEEPAGTARPETGAIDLVGRVRSCGERYRREDTQIKAEAAEAHTKPGTVWLTDMCHSLATVIYVSWYHATPSAPVD